MKYTIVKILMLYTTMSADIRNNMYTF